MIGKLMKYDLKKMTNLLIYLYPIAVCLALITRLINIGKDIQLVFIIGQVFAGITYSLIANILVNTFVQILTTFNRSFYKDESYLTHTLPVSKKQLLDSKYLSAFIVIVVSMIVSVLCLFIVLYTKEFANVIKTVISQVVLGFDVSGTAFIVMIAGVLFAQICFLMSIGFTAIIKSRTYQEKKVLKGLGWFAIFYLGAAIVSLIVISLVFAITGSIDLIFAEVLPSEQFLSIIIIGGVLYFIYAVIFYLISNRMFDKGVNVD